MTTVTIKFRAKADTASRITDTPDGEVTIENDVPAYKVPALTTAHVEFSDPRSTVATMARTHRDLRALLASTRHGFDVPAGAWAYADDTRWTVTPRGNGFMADVVGTFPAHTA